MQTGLQSDLLRPKAEGLLSGYTDYILAVVCVLAVACIRQALVSVVGSHGQLALFSLAVMVAARYGGLGPGLVATLLSAILGDYFFIEPYRTFAVKNPGDAAYLGVFVVVGSGISILSGQLHRAVDLSVQAMEQYHILSEAVPQLVWTAGPEGYWDHVNARWIEYTGTPVSVQLGLGWLRRVYPDEREAVLQRWKSAVATGEDFRLDFRIRRHDGVYRWFDTRAVPQRDAAGRIQKWFGSCTDMHETHQARQALHLQQERLTRIVATAPGVICSFRRRPDGAMCFPYASPRVKEIYGLDPEDLLEDATPVFNLMHPEDVEHVRQTIAESARTMSPWRDEFRVCNPSRGEIWVEGHSHPASEPDGSIEWYGSIADVTERHRIQQALRDHTARLEELTHTLDLAHAFVRCLDGTITYWGQGAAALYGWTAEEAVGRSSHEMLRTEFASSLEEVQAVLLSNGRWEGELRHYRRDGTSVVVASHWAVHYDAQGNPCSVTEVNNDISEQKRIEQELRSSEQRLELAQAAAGIGAWDWNIITNENTCSDEYGPLYGIPRGHHGPPSEAWLRLIHPDDRERVRQELQRALDGSAPYDTEFRVIGPDGAVRWLMGKGKVYRNAAGEAVRMLGVNMDITERKTAAEQLRALSASLISAQEQERRRISRELHDDLTQRLCLMAIDLGKLSSQPPPQSDLTEELRFLQERAVQSAELTRHIAHELHPSILDDLGIETALRSYCEEVARREGIEVEFASRGLPQAIKRETASCLYAVAQESLLNIMKHARASRVVVSLAGGNASIHLSIADDGVGLASDPKTAAVGLGIVNMRERARWVNGEFSIESQPGHGACVTVVVPI